MPGGWQYIADSNLPLGRRKVVGSFARRVQDGMSGKAVILYSTAVAEVGDVTTNMADRGHSSNLSD